ncbi:MAG TPA: dihydroxyacetone kinase subunit DhaL, partial [Chloroflexota bacterium]|nr:dihydroxyacetone kinase subunit DhaL [Chloroflexota bacterium]
DADHGANLDRGMRAVVAKLPGLEDKDVGTILKTVGMTLVSNTGGASGPLYGTLFLQLGAATAGKAGLTFAEWVAAWEAGVSGVVARGKASPGDKTMIDALAPARDALKESLDRGETLAVGLRAAAEAAERGAEQTIPLIARRGRASYLGERSADHQDPGATSAALLLRAAADALDASP